MFFRPARYGGAYGDTGTGQVFSVVDIRLVCDRSSDLDLRVRPLTVGRRSRLARGHPNVGSAVPVINATRWDKQERKCEVLRYLWLVPLSPKRLISKH
jgi:hypothetical protein